MVLSLKIALAVSGALGVTFLGVVAVPRVRHPPVAAPPTIAPVTFVYPGSPGATQQQPGTSRTARRRATDSTVAHAARPHSADALSVVVGPLLRVPIRGEAPDPFPPGDATPADGLDSASRHTTFGTPAVRMPTMTNARQVERLARRLYPGELRRAPIGGLSVVRVRVSDAGEVRLSHIAASSGNLLLDKAALNAVATLRFVPARFEGDRVRSEIDVPVDFRLAGVPSRPAAGPAPRRGLLDFLR